MKAVGENEKTRLLVMNGQKIIQFEENGKWVIEKIQKADNLKAGIYNIYLSKDAEHDKTYEGLILHKTDKFIFQKSGNNFIKHQMSNFETQPQIGLNCKISYAENEKAILTTSEISIKKGISR